ncbi:MAG: hypothetical protein KDA79_22500, partial [Planctomycetaceae bacterium]|nr:hypothetical protein [Planctomycetaceae bacterium]
AMFELKTLRRVAGQAPLSCLLAVAMIYPLALLLYLTKVRLPPDDAAWLITPVFILTIYPGRLMAGWAWARSERKSRPAWWGFRWLSRLLMLPLVGLFVFLLFFTQFIGEHGRGVLFEHHAFLLPVPF